MERNPVPVKAHVPPNLSKRAECMPCDFVAKAASRYSLGTTVPNAGFKDLKASLRNEMSDQPWLIGDRLRDLQDRPRLVKTR